MIVIFSKLEIAAAIGISVSDVEDYLLLKFNEVGIVPLKPNFKFRSIILVMELDMFFDPEDIHMNILDRLVRDMGKYQESNQYKLDVYNDEHNSDRLYLEFFK